MFNIKCAHVAAFVRTASHLQEACWALLINVVVMCIAFVARET